MMSAIDPFRDSLVCIAAATMMGITVLVWAPAATAADAATGQAVWVKGECSVCHGWSGNGVGTADQSAPSMRIRHLTRAKIREVIQCGRPGTNMPYFDRFAYTHKRCYDKTAKELGNQMPERAWVTLQPYEIDPLADYVATKIMGKGAVTRAECLEFFGGTGSQCDKYPER
jgi:mono/diheme cytochrome c family protein